MNIRPVSWLRQTVRRALAATMPRHVYLTHGPQQSRSVCLTFDDGPHPEHTPRLLDRLSELNVPATFFLIGREAEKYPDIVRRIVVEGHEVGNHTYSHPVRNSITSREAAAEVARGSEAIERITGRPLTLYRPPNGKLTARDLVRLWRGGLTTVLWNVDSKDYSKRTADEVRGWLSGRVFQSGDIILFHDNHPHAADVLPEMVASVRTHGLEFTTIPAWTTRAGQLTQSRAAVHRER